MTFPVSPTTDISCSFLLPSANIQRSSMPREPFSNSTITYALSIMSGTCSQSMENREEWIRGLKAKQLLTLALV